jgi:lysophospholipase L1-like esterase
MFDWYEPDVRDLQRSSALLVNGTRPPVFYGSSSIRLWTTLAEDFDPRVINLGFGGSTLEACNYFFERLVLPLKPASLLLYAGDNDLGDGRTAEQTFACFRSLAGKVERTLGSMPFGFVSVKPSPARRLILPEIRALNTLVQQAIKTRPSAYFVDVFSYMLDSDGEPYSRYFSEDGLHMNHQGYLLWSRLLEPYRKQIFPNPAD